MFFIRIPDEAPPLLLPCMTSNEQLVIIKTVLTMIINGDIPVISCLRERCRCVAVINRC
jgi:hypothetical protein